MNLLRLAAKLRPAGSKPGCFKVQRFPVAGRLLVAVGTHAKSAARTTWCVGRRIIYNASRQCQCHGRRAIRHAELSVDGFQMLRYGRIGNAQVLRHLLPVQTLRGQFQYLQLAGREVKRFQSGCPGNIVHPASYCRDLVGHRKFS